MIRIVILAAVAATVPAGATEPRFEAASIRESVEPGTPGTPGMQLRILPDGILFTEVSLLDTIIEAWGISRYQVMGEPLPWMRRARYDIRARAAGVSTRAQSMAMLRQLLTDRFQLRLTEAEKAIRVFTLVERPGGHRLRPSTDEGPVEPAPTPEGVGLRRATMTDIARMLSLAGPVGLPVVDRTGVAGRFDITLPILKRLAPDGPVSEAKKVMEERGLTAFQDTLAEVGLALKRDTVVMPVVVIEFAQRPLAN